MHRKHLSTFYLNQTVKLSKLAQKGSELIIKFSNFERFLLYEFWNELWLQNKTSIAQNCLFLKKKNANMRINDTTEYTNNPIL